ncbi:MAG: S41 family peptidase [Bergeyella sp.]
MKHHFPTLIFLISTFSFAQQNYKTDIDLGGGFLITTFLNLNNEQNQFLLTSPKNADKRAIGSFKSTLGRMFGKLPKEGVFVTLNGTQKGDSLVGNAKVPVLGNLKFKGIAKSNQISGDLLKDDNTEVAVIKGFKTNETKIDYKNFYSKIVEITQNNIYSKDVLQTKEWQSFQTKLKKLCNNAQDDVELFLGFNLLSPKLTFSHYNLIMQKDGEEQDNSEEKTPTVIFEEKTPETAYLKIKNFSTSQTEIAEIFPRITAKNYKNLIVDLRENGGGGLEAAFEFGKHILSEQTEVGYFITNKFGNPDIQSFSSLPATKAETTNGFIEELKHGKGAKMVIPKSNNAIFSGKLYVLTDKKTASTCEPIVYVLKNTKRATIIGENTAGAMLSAAPFEISGKYKLLLPLADFYTYDGVRLDQVGVSPNIRTESENALNKALALIGK